MEPEEDTSDAMHFEDFLAEQNAAGNEIDDEDIEQFGDVVNSSVLDVLQSGTTDEATLDDDVTFISKDIVTLITLGSFCISNELNLHALSGYIVQ